VVGGFARHVIGRFARHVASGFACSVGLGLARLAISSLNGYKFRELWLVSFHGACRLGGFMTMTARGRTRIFGLLMLVVLSAGTMIWMFWHYPRGTAIATLAMVAAFAVLVRLARAIETDISERHPGGERA